MENKALLVIDMQNDYLWEQRKDMFSYNTPQLVSEVNKTIKEHKEKGFDIIYVVQLFPNIITNRWIIGFSIKGTEGAELYDGMDLVNDTVVEKNLPDTFTSSQFKKLFAEKKYKELHLCGLDECGCVGATAKGAVKAGCRTVLISAATGSRFPASKQKKTRSTLTALGVIYE